MTASETNCFARNLVYIVEKLIDDTEDIGWELYRKTMQFVDLCYLPVYDDEDIDDLDSACEAMNKVWMVIRQSNSNAAPQWTGMSI